MTDLNLDELLEVTAAMKADRLPLPYIGDNLFAGFFTGKVYSKGRPIVTKRGHAFTPANTRKFEKAVRDWLTTLNVEFIFCPIEVTIELLEPKAKSMTGTKLRLAELGAVFSTVGDVDNRAKAILDGSEGELFLNDSQISNLTVSRQYADTEGFYIAVTRSGYSANEVENITRLAKQR